MVYALRNPRFVLSCFYAVWLLGSKGLSQNSSQSVTENFFTKLGIRPSTRQGFALRTVKVKKKKQLFPWHQTTQAGKHPVELNNKY